MTRYICRLISRPSGKKNLSLWIWKIHCQIWANNIYYSGQGWNDLLTWRIPAIKYIYDKYSWPWLCLIVEKMLSSRFEVSYVLELHQELIHLALSFKSKPYSERKKWFFSLYTGVIVGIDKNKKLRGLRRLGRICREAHAEESWGICSFHLCWKTKRGGDKGIYLHPTD